MRRARCPCVQGGQLKVTVALHRFLATTKRNDFLSQRSFIPKFQWPCLPNSPRRCCLQFGELVSFVWRDLNACGRLRQALVLVQTRNSLGRRLRPFSLHTLPFRPLRRARLLHLVMATRVTRAFSYNLSTQRRHAQTGNTASLPAPAPGADHTHARFGTNTSGGDCTTHRVRKYIRPSTKPMSVNGEHFHTWRVAHLILWADVLFKEKPERA